jgi:uncharacterized protein (DUF1330 family)
MVIVAILTIRPGALDAFRAFEARAARVMARHGGAIERAVFVDGDPAREIHVVRFASAEGFAAYRADPELTAMAAAREAAIAATEVLVGDDGPDYMAAVAGVTSWRG